MSSKSAQHGPLWHLFHRDEQHIDWRVRSRAVYEPEPEPIFGGTRLQAWADGQLRAMGFNPALMRRPAQPVQRHTGGITPIPPTPRDTGEQPQLDFPVTRENREWADVDTVKKLPLRDLLNLPLPDNALPVQRQIAAPETDNDVPSDAQMTLPWSNHAQESRPLNVLELPGWIGTARASRPLPAGLGFSDPNLVPDLPTTPQTKEQADAWLNSALPPVEVWEEYQPPVLAELPQDALAASDRWTVLPWSEEPSSGLGPMPQDEARAQLLAIPEEAMVPDLEGGLPTELHERTVRNQIFKQAIDGLCEKKESE